MSSSRRSKARFLVLAPGVLPCSGLLRTAASARADSSEADRIKAAISSLEKKGCVVSRDSKGGAAGGYWLDLSESALVDADLVYVNALPQLESLSLLRTQLTDSGLLRIDNSKWNSLLELKISDLSIGSQVLARISKMRRVERLFLVNAHLNDENMECLKDLTTLTWLDLEGNRLTDAGLRHILALRNLGFLGLTDTRVGDESLATIARAFKHLQILDLAFTRITDAGLSPLGSLPELHELNLVNTSITDKSADSIREIQELDTLALTGTSIGDEFLSRIASRTKLSRLYLAKTRLTGRGIAHLKPLTKLTVLNLSSTGIGNADLKPIAGMSNSLEELYLDDTAVTDAGLEHLLGLRALRVVTFSGTLITEAGFKEFQRKWREYRSAPAQGARD
jgi:Leucine-rich repeat (LRR) protein